MFSLFKNSSISKRLITLTINYYKNNISPHKGYQCACRLHHDDVSCSDYALQQLNKNNLFGSIKAITARFKKCRRQSDTSKERYQYLLREHGLAVLTLACITGCSGGGGSDSGNSVATPTPTPTPIVGQFIINDVKATPTRQIPVQDIPYTTARSDFAQRNGRTNTNGAYQYLDAETVTFTLLNKSFGPTTAQAIISPTELAASYCSDITDDNSKNTCQSNVHNNLTRTLLSIDADNTLDNGISLYAGLTEFPAELNASPDVYELALAKKLALDGRQTAPLFKPSLGINLEEPQPEADDVGGQPIPFVDLFRIGRPFPEYSCSHNVYDEYGWPVEIPAECADETHDVLNVPSYATTLIARFAPSGTIPTGKYTVLYDGSGNIQYSGIGSKIVTESSQGRDIVEITSDLLTNRGSAGLRIQIKDITAGDHIRNMRIIMPGGICQGNPFLHVYSEDECPAGAYQSFVSRYEQDRNAIVFNPQFMNFLKDFKVIRTMNFMKASPQNPCYQFTDDAYRECILQDFNWDQRARMDDAMWGGSFRTDLAKRAGRGVPLEVTIALANQLQRDPWFNIPHNATNDYIEKYATYVRDNLNSTLKAHIEYSNEPWNGIFWANPYTIAKGKERGLDADYANYNDYWTGLYYYTERSVEMFNIWQNVWGSTDRLVRIINTQHNGGQFASRNMLNHKGAYQTIDVLASAPYFFGCWSRANARCTDEDAIPMVLKDITAVDDIFNIFDDPDNPYGMDSTRNFVKLQAEVASEYNVDLYAYEGGQHLTVTRGEDGVAQARENEILELFRAANRDPRMAERYLQLLNGWKEEGGKLFTLYTLPQTYHAFGSFGIKEHLAQERKDAPKYDASMQFQEEQGRCWWENCE